MTVRLTPFGAQSLTVPAGVVSREYRFRQGRWTEVFTDDDLFYLLAHEVVLREEQPLAPATVRSTRVEAVTVTYNDDGCERAVVVEPEKAITLPSHLGRMLVKRGYCKPVTAAEFLAEKADARIAITRAGGMGDVLLTTPAVSELARQFPQAEITYRTSDYHRRVVERCPGVARVAGLGEAYDYAPFDFEADLSWYVERHELQHVHRIDLFGQALGVAVSDPQMHLWVSDEDRQRAGELLAPARAKGKPLVGVQVVNPIFTRLPGPDKLRWIVTRLAQEGLYPVFLGAAEDALWDRAGGLNLCGKLDLGSFFGVVEALDAVLVGDSGPLHVANALGKPTVALFGPVHPSVRVKGCPNCRTLTANEEVKCGPCNDQQLQRCAPPAPCLEAIPDDLIVEAVAEAVHGAAHNPGL